VLRDRFGHREFLPQQRPALESVLAGRNLLVVMPTGSGKSLLYQLPALLEDGLTLVVSPLIALMKDQVDELRRKGVPATFVNSSLSPGEQHQRLADCAAGVHKLLYVAPERFRNSGFLDMIDRVRVARIAVDEAHCISQWGHDFRPDYRRLAEFRSRLGAPRITALTATATVRVQKDIIEALGLAPGDVDVYVSGFDRPNLAIRVKHASSEENRIAFLTEFIRRGPGSGIIYTGTRRAAESVAEALRPIEPTIQPYHAGLNPEQRSAVQEAFLRGEAHIVTATTAFGMGIDKSDVRFVVHFNFPASIEQYYQEIGRAGRDGLPSDCILLYSPADRRLRDFFIDLSYPPREIIEAVYEALWTISEDPITLTYREIAASCVGDVRDGHVGATVRLLDEAGVTRAWTGRPVARITLDKPGAAVLETVQGPVRRRIIAALSAEADIEKPGTVEITIETLCRAAGLHDDQVRRGLAALAAEGRIGYEPPFRGRGIEKLVHTPPPFDELPIDWARLERLRRAEEEKLEAIEDFIHTDACRRATVIEYFGETPEKPCGICDNCGRAAKRSGDSTAHPGGTVVEDALDDLQTAVLLCVQHLRFGAGKILISQILTGSASSNVRRLHLDRHPLHGVVSGKQKSVRNAVDALLDAGLLTVRHLGGRPTLHLTRRGREAVDGITVHSWRGRVEPIPAPGDRRTRIEDTVQPARPGLAQSASREFKSPSETAAQAVPTPPAPEMPTAAREQQADGAPVTEAALQNMLDHLTCHLLDAPREKARAALPALRRFHPAGVVRALAQRFAEAAGVRPRSRAVWLAGEFGDVRAVPFLVFCTTHEDGNVRRLAASALGKIAHALRQTAADHAQLADHARQALESLATSATARLHNMQKRRCRISRRWTDRPSPFIRATFRPVPATGTLAGGIVAAVGDPSRCVRLVREYSRRFRGADHTAQSSLRRFHLCAHRQTLEGVV